MNCRKMKSNFEELLMAPETASQAAREHLTACPDCRRELAAMQATFSLLDEWQAPAVNDFFPVRMQAALRAEQGHAGWLERLRMRMLLGNHTARPIAAFTLVLVLILGGGAYAGVETLTGQQAVVTPQSATLRDLQSLDQNKEVFQQLNDIDQYGSSNDSGNPGSM